MTKQLYLPDSAVLVTRFMTAGGVGELLDFMPPISGRATDRHRLVRMLRVPRGQMRFAMDLRPRFDYARAKHKTDVSEHGAVMTGSDGMRLTVHMVASKSAASGPSSTAARLGPEAGRRWPARHLGAATRATRPESWSSR